MEVVFAECGDVLPRIAAEISEIFYAGSPLIFDDVQRFFAWSALDRLLGVSTRLTPLDFASSFQT